MCKVDRGRSVEVRPRVVGRLGSGVRVSASFQTFALTAGGNVLDGDGNCREEETLRRDMSEGGKCPTLR